MGNVWMQNIFPLWLILTPPWSGDWTIAGLRCVNEVKWDPAGFEQSQTQGWWRGMRNSFFCFIRSAKGLHCMRHDLLRLSLCVDIWQANRRSSKLVCNPQIFSPKVESRYRCGHAASFIMVADWGNQEEQSHQTMDFKSHLCLLWTLRISCQHHLK